MRLEYKFLVKNNYLEDLRGALLPYVIVDKFAESEGSNEYTVRSIYFDNSDLKYYHDKIDGLKIRKKIRIRGYNNYNSANLVFLEIKRKYDNFIGKNRSPINYENVDNLLHSGDFNSYVVSVDGFEKCFEDAEMFLHHVFRHSLKPTVLIVFDREAYFSKFDTSLRITFDKNLRYSAFPSLENLYEECDLVSAIPKYFVLEIKFIKGYPKWLQNIVMKFGLSRISVSKYTICLDNQLLLKPMKRKSTIAFTSGLFEIDE